MAVPKPLLLPILTLLTLLGRSQTPTVPPPREITATRLVGTIQIDGELNEAAWKKAPPITDFVEFRPESGRPEKPGDKTEAYFLYDDNALYIGGYCHFRRDSISTELVGRDQIGSNDFVGIFLDTYRDKINAVGFFVTPLGEQYDARYSAPNDNGNDEDPSWNAVWTSESKLHADGWTFEMRIPYSAIRFSPKNNVWGFNMLRRNKKQGRDYFWNPVDNKINGFVNQYGIIKGLDNIKPPLRLSLSPYFSAYVNHYPYDIKDVKNTTYSVNGGADIKYGIDQNFTLDMTLIPDFGQVASDKTVLNLTPFEVQYEEKRPFFTEGTDLFTKGGLFYSRRVGGEPINKYNIQDQLAQNEEIADNPSQSKLINAFKISGRSGKKTGLGFFNAVTQAMYAEVVDTVTGKKRKIETGPLTNFNIMVVDQSLKNNSSVSFINTNVMRSGTAPDANVNAFLYSINNKKNSYNFFGNHSLSSIFSGGTGTYGYYQKVGGGKTGGSFNFQLQEELADAKYDKNDMGIMNYNNFMNHSVYMGYKLLKPKSFYNNLYLNFSGELIHRFSDKHYQANNYYFNTNGQLKNLWFMNFSVNLFRPGFDFYEPRTAGRYFKTSMLGSAGLFLQSDQSKKYSASVFFRHGRGKMFATRRYYSELTQYYKFSDRFSLSTDFNLNAMRNDAGYATTDGSDVLFGRRNRLTADNNFGFKYNFNKRMGMSATARHYWSQVLIKQYYTLQTDGTLLQNNLYKGNNDVNLNLFNIDYTFFWEFRPGSFLNLNYKKAVYDDVEKTDDPYFKNFMETMRAKQNNNFSIKLLYYLDWQDIVKKKKTPVK